MVRIKCVINGKTTYTNPTTRRLAIQAVNELLASGMIPKDAKYTIVDAVER